MTTDRKIDMAEPEAPTISEEMVERLWEELTLRCSKGPSKMAVRHALAAALVSAAVTVPVKLDELARSCAVAAVDNIHGFTMEFAPSPAAHRDKYDLAETAILRELERIRSALVPIASAEPVAIQWQRAMIERQKNRDLPDFSLPSSAFPDLRTGGGGTLAPMQRCIRQDCDCFDTWSCSRPTVSALPITSAGETGWRTVPLDDGTVKYVLRYGARCRDCADEDGVCPTTGFPCDSERAERTIRHVINALNYGFTQGYLPPVPPTGPKP